MEQTLLEMFQESIKYQPYYPGENQQREQNLKRYKQVVAIRKTARALGNTTELPKILETLKKNEVQPGSPFLRKYWEIFNAE